MAIENNQLTQFESIRVYVLRTLKKNIYAFIFKVGSRMLALVSCMLVFL